ncbi:MAG: YcaO-like family protein [Desulfovibrio sp.]|nr:YcaO-like family protein [Desulfovibrio sp.]
MPITYQYTVEKTVGTTGYYRCEPDFSTAPFPRFLDLLETTPFDTFLHKALLNRLRSMSLEALTELLTPLWPEMETRKALSALLYEASVLEKHLSPIRDRLPADTDGKASPLTSFWRTERTGAGEIAGTRENTVGSGAGKADSPSPGEADALSAGRTVLRSLDANRRFHAPLSEKTLLGPLEILCDRDLPLLPGDDEARSALSALFKRYAGKDAGERPLSLAERILLANDALLEAGVLEGPEMRHEASLSPIALLRNWTLERNVAAETTAFRLVGTLTSYGRGLSLSEARISCLMEIVERVSSYAGVSVENGIVSLSDQRVPKALVKARYGASSSADFVLPGPCTGEDLDAPVYWVPGQDRHGEQCLLPFQATFLSANLPEPDYYETGSTGLAAGMTLAEARVAALLEILERDALSTVPFHKNRAFLLKSRDPLLQSLLDDYEARSIRVQFMDLTHEFGVPVYKSFVTAVSGEVSAASACKLSGRACALSALTETPWPYSLLQRAPEGKASGPGFSNLPVRYLEDLPDFDTKIPEQNLAMLEDRLADFGLEPYYVDISRSDLDLPVVRAFVPGLSEGEGLSARMLARLRGLFPANS